MVYVILSFLIDKAAAENVVSGRVASLSQGLLCLKRKGSKIIDVQWGDEEQIHTEN